MGSLGLSLMRQKIIYENVGLGSKLVLPRISIEQGIDKWTVYSVEPGMVEHNGKTEQVLFLCGTGETFDGKPMTLRLSISPKGFQDFLFKEHWFQVDEVVTFDDPGTQEIQPSL